MKYVGSVWNARFNVLFCMFLISGTEIFGPILVAKNSHELAMFKQKNIHTCKIIQETIWISQITYLPNSKKPLPHLYSYFLNITSDRLNVDFFVYSWEQLSITRKKSTYKKINPHSKGHHPLLYDEKKDPAKTCMVSIETYLIFCQSLCKLKGIFRKQWTEW